jgi:hypothetical protein
VTYRQALQQAIQRFGDDALIRDFIDNIEGSLVDYLDALSRNGQQEVDIKVVDIVKGTKTARVWSLGNNSIGKTYAWIFAAKDYELLK